jgi:hypothetical protein
MPNQSSSTSKQSNQIDLRTIFLVLLCASVGLTCASAPPSRESVRLHAFLGTSAPSLDLHSGLLAFVAAAMIVGLAQQLRTILTRQLALANDSPDIRFARLFAIVWRVVIAAVISICLVAKVLILRQVVSLPDNDTFQRNAFPDALLEVAMIFVLSDSIRRRRPSPIRKSRKYDVAACLVGIVLALVVLPDAGFIAYLVHLATQNIEHGQPLKFQRLGTFPDQYTAHFHLFWTSLAAAIALALAALMLVFSNRQNIKQAMRGVVTFIYLAILISCGAFCWRFYYAVFPKLSPDFASVGFGSNSVDFCCAAFFAAVLSGVFAYRLSTTDELAAIENTPKLAEVGGAVFHESWLCLIVLLGAMAAYVVGIIRNEKMSFLSAESILVFVGDVMRYTFNYIPVAILILTLQLIYVRWRQYREPMPWSLPGLAASRFFWNFIALFILLAVAIPTMAIYCFVFWLGPWYLYTSP